MSRHSFSLFVYAVFLVLISVLNPVEVWASPQAAENLKQAERYVDQALGEANQGHLAEAKQAYGNFRDTWRQIEDGVKEESGQAYKDIESQMGQVDYAILQNKANDIVQALQGLKDVNEKFMRGLYPRGGQVQTETISLGDFLVLLQQTKTKAQEHDQEAALAAIARVRQSWLSVEGAVVAQSAAVYNAVERDMVTVNAMLAANPPDDQGAVQLLEQMAAYLSPLASKAGYTLWDAAMILMREGLEALLVVAALLAFAKKSNSTKAKGWIWLGVSVGLALSVILAVIVKFVLSSGAFGSNNALIAGWTGVIAAVMLLYMSYWLHNQAHIADWQQFISTKSQSALDAGRLISLGILSFLAVFREGTETVLFFIGMVNQISGQDLLLGLALGSALIAMLAYLLIKVGLKLPMRPFFVASSVVVFYLCVKFTGMGIHSLQLAGALPSSAAPGIPSIDFLALYPSWQSAVPQLILVIGAMAVLLAKRAAGARQSSR